MQNEGNRKAEKTVKEKENAGRYLDLDSDPLASRGTGRHWWGLHSHSARCRLDCIDRQTFAARESVVNGAGDPPERRIAQLSQFVPILSGRHEPRRKDFITPEAETARISDKR